VLANDKLSLKVTLGKKITTTVNLFVVKGMLQSEDVAFFWPGANPIW
jgi:hypothetical protein